MRRRRIARMAPQAFRHTIQLGVVAFIVYAAMGSYWRNYKIAHNHPRLVKLMEGEFWATLYAINESTLELFGDSYEASFGMLGMPWSARFFGFETTDPILTLSHALVTGSMQVSLLLGSLTTVLIAAVLGKIFCSHICPMRLLFELGQLLRGGLLWLNIPLPRMHMKTRLGGWILLGGLLASISTGMGVWYIFLPYVSVGASLYMSITAGTTAGLFALPLGWLMTDALFAPGLFCHNLCPQGFLLEKLGHFSRLVLHSDNAVACPQKCQACIMVCPYQLSPRDQTHLPGCDNCGKCVPVCPERKLQRRFSLPIISTILFIIAFSPTVAHAHHNKGLPHYGYYDNYPQVPTEEEVVIDGNWELGATIFNFQGYERAESDTPHDVKIFSYLYDLTADQAYLGPVDFEIFFDGDIVARYHRDGVNEEIIYSTRETMPESGTYELVAHIPGSQTSPRLEFEIDLAEDSISWSLILGLTLPLLPVFVLAILGRSRRGRSLRMKESGVGPSDINDGEYIDITNDEPPDIVSLPSRLLIPKSP